MSAPDKPWEIASKMQDQQNYCRPSVVPGTGRNILNSSNGPQASSQPVGPVRVVVPPPLPPRPPQLSMAVPPRPMYGVAAPNMFNGYSSYSGYGGYSSYGNYPGSMYLPGSYGYGSYGQPSAFENRFLQAAEESSRNAFQSIESLVRAFTSVSMMLESTYHAMYSSFRAILGVVDNFSRLRQMFAQFLSTIAILRIVKNFYHRLLYWLGVMKHNPQANQIWEAAAVTGGTTSQQNAYSSWPLFTFIGLLFGGPYLISKFFSSNTLEQKKWDLKKGTFYKASFPYEAASDAELSFCENEIINIAPPEYQLQNGGGWLLASNQQGKVGYVPINRLNLPLRHNMKQNDPNIPFK